MTDKLKKIRSSGISRGLSLAKVSLTGAIKTGFQQLKNPFLPSSERTKAWQSLLLSHAQSLTGEMTRLKGSLMKAGQMLSLYGERFLPPEVNAVLKTLQSQSLPLEWKAIELELARELGRERLQAIEVDPEPIGAASLGQVHAAVITASGEKMALKVKYPGIEKAIDTDLKWLRRFLKAGGYLPLTPTLDPLFEEVRRMLHQEVDYPLELAQTELFHEFLAGDRRFIVPKPKPDYCTGRILATSFEAGVSLDDPAVSDLSLERRNGLGMAFLELYLKELFVLRRVQTDPHFGNFRIRLDPTGREDAWVLFDFGAVRKLDDEFLVKYHKLLRGAYFQDRELTAQALQCLGLVRPNEVEDTEIFLSLCLLMTEPVRCVGPYRWATSDLPERAMAFLPRLAFRTEARLPPPEMLWLDRKSGGVFLLLAKLRCEFDSRSLVEHYLGLSMTHSHVGVNTTS